jgi:branched-chain amino acid transport system permease protein
MLASCLVAMLLERVAYRPLRTAPRLVPLITAVGASLFLQNTALGFFGPQTRAYPVPDILAGDKTWTVLGVTMQRIQVIVIATAVVAVIGLTMLISRTRAGKSIRAVAEDREIASLMGIDVDRAILITFALGGLLAGIAAVQFGMTYGQVNFHIGFSLGIAAFTASVLGGIGNIRGAALGGLILGLLYSVGPALLFTGFHIPAPFQLQDVITFSVLVLVLIFRPGGILGSGEEEKV